jgi:hypothetical protein
MTQKGLMNRKIPTVLGLIILIAGLISGVILVNNRTSFQSKAGPTESPKNIKITNRGSGTFSVSWTTDIPLTGYLKYSEDPAKINLPSGDVRDQISGTSQSYTNHYVNITGLGANKTIYFLIGSGSQTYNDNDKPFQARTLVSISAPAEDIVSGKIINGDGSPVNGAIVFVDMENTETLSTISKNDGSWRINISTARTKDGKLPTIDPKKTLLSIFASAGTSGTATAITNTEKARPVPDIILGKNQSFVESSIDLANLSSQNASKSGGFALSESQLSSDTFAKNSLVTFLNPAIDGELIATTSPELKIKLATGSGVVFTVGTQKSTNITATNSGEWAWSPLEPFTSGLNNLLIEFLDDKGAKQQVSRKFNVLAIGDIGGLPAFTATPSATPNLIVVAPTDGTTMPETTSENLNNSGTLGTSILLTLSGIILFGLGRYLKKKWR